MSHYTSRKYSNKNSVFHYPLHMYIRNECISATSIFTQRQEDTHTKQRITNHINSKSILLMILTCILFWNHFLGFLDTWHNNWCIVRKPYTSFQARKTYYRKEPMAA